MLLLAGRIAILIKKVDTNSKLSLDMLSKIFRQRVKI
jgi:hypothetical protein